MDLRRASCAIRAISSSTFLPTIIIMSGNSSITTTIHRQGFPVRRVCLPSIHAGQRIGQRRAGLLGVLDLAAFLKPARLRTPHGRHEFCSALQFQHARQRRALAASFMSGHHGANRCGYLVDRQLQAFRVRIIDQPPSFGRRLGTGY